MARERMSTVDLAWLRMDSPRNLMQIVAIHVLGTPTRYDRVRDLLASERMMRFRRFRQRVEFDAVGGAHWVDDEDFDIRNHLVRARLPQVDARAGSAARSRAGSRAGSRGRSRGFAPEPAPGAQVEALRQFAAALASEPLDPARPLWQFHLIEDYDGGSALVQRIHHCIADGIALMRVLMELTDTDATGQGSPLQFDPQAHSHADPHAGWYADSDPSAGSDPTRTAGGGGLESNPWRPYVEPIARRTIRAIETGEKAWEKALGVLVHPERALALARAGNQLLGDALHILLMADDSHTPFKGTPGLTKRMAWNEPLPLGQVKLVAHVLQASVNDVLLSCVAGALRRYLRALDRDVTGVEIRALVPVNLRAPTTADELGNRFGLVPLELPVGIANPIGRVYEVHRRMEQLKQGYQPLLAYTLLAAVGLAPKSVQTPILEYLAGKATAVMTNVPGPQQPLYFAGSPIERMMFWVPQSGDIGMGVSILSYNGGVQFGIVSDAGLTPDPQRVIDGFGREFDLLIECLMMMPRELVLAEEFDVGAFEHLLFDTALRGHGGRSTGRRRSGIAGGETRRKRRASRAETAARKSGSKMESPT